MECTVATVYKVQIHIQIVNDRYIFFDDEDDPLLTAFFPTDEVNGRETELFRRSASSEVKSASANPSMLKELPRDFAGENGL
jgi:hypothetical protein